MKLGMTDSAVIASHTAVDYALSCLEDLQPRLAQATCDLIRDRKILIAEINSDFPAAQMWQCEDGRCAIVLTRALHQVYYRLIRALCTRLTFSSGEETTIPFEATCEIVSDIAFWYKNSLESAGPSYPITTNQVVVASRITKEAMVFCLAHELSHAVFRLHGDLARFAENGKEEEFSADLGALVALLSTADNTEIELVEIRYCAAEMFLWVQIVFERLGLEFCFDEHPTFQERLEMLRLALTQFCKSSEDARAVSSLAACFAAICAKVSETLNAPDSEEKALTRAAQSRIAELDALLTECTGGFVPDYFSFYPRASKLLQQPGSETFFRIMARCTEEFANTCIDKTKTATDEERWRAFQKFKLFLGLSKNMDEPVRSMFEAALQHTSFQRVEPI